MGLHRCIVWRFSLSCFLGVLDLDLPAGQVPIYGARPLFKRTPVYTRLELGCRNALCPGVENLTWFVIPDWILILSCIQLTGPTFGMYVRDYHEDMIGHAPAIYLLNVFTNQELGLQKDNILGFTVIALVIASVQAVGALRRYVLLVLDALHLLPGLISLLPLGFDHSGLHLPSAFCVGGYLKMIQRSWTRTRQQESGLYIFSLSHRQKRKPFPHHFILPTGYFHGFQRPWKY